MSEERQQQAQRNRELMPLFAAWLDETRAVFGPVRVIWAREGDVMVGAVPAEEREKGSTCQSAST